MALSSCHCHGHTGILAKTRDQRCKEGAGHLVAGRESLFWTLRSAFKIDQQRTDVLSRDRRRFCNDTVQCSATEWQVTGSSDFRAWQKSNAEPSTWDQDQQSEPVKALEPVPASHEGATGQESRLEGSFCLMNEGPESCSFRLVALTEEDIPAMEALLNTVHFDPPVWEDLLQMDRRDLLGIWDCDGQGQDFLAGLVSAVYYPRPKHESVRPPDDRNPFGWIGNVVVHPRYRSRGLARVLLSDAVHHLQSGRRCRAVLLDATPMGKQVYDKMGFQDVCPVHRMQIAPEDLQRALENLESGGVEAGGGATLEVSSLGGDRTWSESEAGSVSGAEDGESNERGSGFRRKRRSENTGFGLLGSILRDITESDLDQEVTLADVSSAAAAVRRIDEEDTWNAVVACDGQVFGADRALLLRRWQRRSPECAVWLPNTGPNRASEVDGEKDRAESSSLGGPVKGFAFAHSRRECHYLGPVVAGDGASAGALLLTQLKQIARQNRSGDPRPCVIYIVEPPEGLEATGQSTRGDYLAWSRFLEGLGFRREDTTIRQALGDAPDCNSLQHYFAVAALDLG
ncbi:hypothetical protein KFL_005340080 [Klebsormidium nitens]|uniref:N-acetyltransferase domain-containing protein n=1 Tax=Klebsormidium nitens TaxID=105231 RepID=A0A1Y1IFX9_KLENI|nr:hypothetical protein KFL_005340080 [Klebsormidium nitens]|eukprot:GAQ89543.1 hypothetical protein KFL_005340080 [Klebsormidium nitens]